MTQRVLGANVSERQALSPPVAVSTVIFAVRDSQIYLPLVRRVRAPFFGDWALPGGPVTWEEALTAVAVRTLRETTGLEPRYLEQLYTFGEPDRAPAERVISIVYWAMVDPQVAAAADTVNSDPQNVAWFPAADLPDLAFDHAQIVQYALQRLRTKAEYATIAHNLLGGSFTLLQLRGVHEAILGRPLDPGNFRRQMLASGELESTGERSAGGAHRPATLYRYAGQRSDA